jgi:hypothetical protein
VQRQVRISIAALMSVVLVAGLGFAALRSASETWAGVMVLLDSGILMLAVVGVICRGRDERARWLGFVLFCGGYLVLENWFSLYKNSPFSFPTITLVEFLGDQLGVEPDSFRHQGGGWPSGRILHCLWALVFGVLGSVLAGLLIGVSAARRTGEARSWAVNRQLSRARLRWTMSVGAAGVGPSAAVALACGWMTAGIWAGVVFLLTCGLLGLAGLGAVFSRGGDRATWLGAALFGWGYMALAFGQAQLLINAPHLPTEPMLNALFRRDGPPISTGFPDFVDGESFRMKTQRLLEKLDQPILFHFVDPTPLDAVLKYIREQTGDRNIPGIPIYVDPWGLAYAEQSLTSTVQLDVGTIAVRDGLRLCLKQLGLRYTVRDGFIMISAAEYATIPIYDDPVQVVGHCLLALLAAWLGALVAPLVSDRKQEPGGSDVEEPA